MEKRILGIWPVRVFATRLTLIRSLPRRYPCSIREDWWGFEHLVGVGIFMFLNYIFFEHL